MNKSETSDPILRLLDDASSYSFVIGVLFTLVIGLGIGANTLQQEREAKVMADEKQVETKIESNKGTSKRSWDGVANLAPNQGGENTQSGQDSQSNQQSEQQENQNSSQSNDKE